MKKPPSQLPSHSECAEGVLAALSDYAEEDAFLISVLVQQSIIGVMSHADRVCACSLLSLLVEVMQKILEDADVDEDEDKNETMQ